MKRLLGILATAPLLATPAAAEFSWGMGGPWKVHKVEVPPSDNPFKRPGTHCYLTNKNDRQAMSLSVDKDGVMELQAWLNNIDVPQEANLFEVNIQFVKSNGTERRTWHLKNVVVMDVSDSGRPGDVYLFHFLDENFTDPIYPGISPPPTFKSDFVISGLSHNFHSYGKLRFVSLAGEELAEFSLENSYNAMKELRQCYLQIKNKDPGPRKKF